MAQGIHERFEQELGSTLLIEFAGIEISEPKWVEKDKYCELWFNKTQVWVDPISDCMMTVTLMNGDKSWDVVMERNMIALVYMIIGFNHYQG